MEPGVTKTSKNPSGPGLSRTGPCLGPRRSTGNQTIADGGVCRFESRFESPRDPPDLGNTWNLSENGRKILLRVRFTFLGSCFTFLGSGFTFFGSSFAFFRVRIIFFRVRITFFRVWITFFRVWITFFRFGLAFLGPGF